MKLIKVLLDDQIEQLHRLASEIQIEYYTPIVGQGQAEYLVESYQSPRALRDQIERENYTYYLLHEDGVDFGYVGIQPQGKELFLSKFYIKTEMRGRGYGRETVDFIIDLCREQSIESVYLDVNRQNGHSIEIYQALGFEIESEIERDVGGGYIAEDYVMRRLVN